MKNVLIAVVLLFSSWAYAADKPKPESPFVLRDVYVQAENQRPYLVTELPTPTQILHLGDKLYGWITIQLRTGATSPCTSRDEEPCQLEMRIVKKDADRSKLEFDGQEVRIDDEVGYNFYYPISRESALGEKVFIFRVRCKDKILTSLEVPLEVKK